MGQYNREIAEANHEALRGLGWNVTPITERDGSYSFEATTPDGRRSRRTFEPGGAMLVERLDRPEHPKPAPSAARQPRRSASSCSTSPTGDELRAALELGRNDAIRSGTRKQAPDRFPAGLDDPSLRNAYALGWEEGAAIPRFDDLPAPKRKPRGHTMPKQAPKTVKHKPSASLKLELRNEGKTADGKLKLWEGYAGPVFLGHIVAKTAAAGMKQLKAIARKQIG